MGSQIVTNTKKDRKQKKNYGDIEALADAMRALKNIYQRKLDIEGLASLCQMVSRANFYGNSSTKYRLKRFCSGRSI